MFVYPKAGHRPALGIFFSLPQEEEKMKQMLNTLNISDFISKCTNYRISIIINRLQYFVESSIQRKLITRKIFTNVIFEKLNEFGKLLSGHLDRGLAIGVSSICLCCSLLKTKFSLILGERGLSRFVYSLHIGNDAIP